MFTHAVLALLFNINGALVDSFHAWFAAMNATLHRFGLPVLAETEFLKQYWGHDLY
jgi:phosphoglycolate phosphatase-like HAD superfamily hydrolase